MKFSHTTTYDAPPADVQAMLTDPAFREQVCAATNAVRHDVTIDGSGKGMKVVVDQTQPTEGIPASRRSSSATRSGSCSASPGGRVEGIADRRDPRQARRLQGRHRRSTPTADGTNEMFAGEIKVKIPLVGGKLEGLIGDLLRSALKSEERVGRGLAGRRPLGPAQVRPSPPRRRRACGRRTPPRRAPRTARTRSA